MAERAPDWLVERLAAGDLEPGVAAAVRARVEPARLEAIDASNRSILAAHPPARAAAEVRRRLDAERRRRRALAIPVLACAASLTLVLLVMARGDETEPTPGEHSETITPKGEVRPHLVIYKKTSAGPARLSARSRLRPGDLIQVAYVAAGRRYGAIASIDARGAVTWHLPDRPGTAAPLSGRGEIPVPHAFELDDSPGFERFVFATSDRPFSTAAVADRLTPGGVVGQIPGVGLTELLLEKETR